MTTLEERVERLEASDNVNGEMLTDLQEGQRQLDLKIDEIGADVKDLKSDVKRIDEKLDMLEDKLAASFKTLAEGIDDINRRLDRDP